MDYGLWGGIVGGGIGLLGGAFGTWASIRNTNGPLERAFMVRVAVWAWVTITAFLALLMLLPRPYNQFLWIPYGIALPWGIVMCNRRQRQIRTAESAPQPHMNGAGHLQ